MEVLWREVCSRQQFLHDLYTHFNRTQGANVAVFIITNSLDMTWSLSEAVTFFIDKNGRRMAAIGCIISVVGRFLGFVLLCWVLSRRGREASFTWWF